MMLNATAPDLPILTDVTSLGLIENSEIHSRVRLCTRQKICGSACFTGPQSASAPTEAVAAPLEAGIEVRYA